MRSSKTGFTLIELMVVMAIVLALSLIAAPVITTARNRAITEEAVAGLAFLRVSLKEYYFINREYQNLTDDLTANYPEGVRAGALDGVYFQDACYRIENTPGFIYCYPHKSIKREARNLSANGSDTDCIRMDRDTGDLWQSGVPNSGFKQL